MRSSQAFAVSTAVIYKHPVVCLVLNVSLWLAEWLLSGKYVGSESGKVLYYLIRPTNNGKGKLEMYLAAVCFFTQRF